MDFHSFEGILYTTPILGGLLQHGLRRALSACMIGGARLAARTWPPLERWLRKTVPGGGRRVEGIKAWTAGVWWRRAPPVSWRAVPAPYDPGL